MPDAPVQILPNQTTGSAPAAPVQIAANGSGSAPAAPVQIAANGSGSTPAAPVQIAANGVGGSAPAAPVQIAANGVGGSAPAAPVKVLPSQAEGGESLVHATGSITVLGNAMTGAVEIDGWFYGVNQTTPLPGKTLAESYAIALAAQINGDFAELGIRPTAEVVNGTTILLRAGIPGIAGNLVPLSSLDPLVGVSGPRLTGGAGDETVVVSGALTINGSTPITIGQLAVDRYVGLSSDQYTSNAWSANTDGTFLTGWWHSLGMETVMGGTFPNLVLAGYRYLLTASRLVNGTLAESAQWRSATLPTQHRAWEATGWAPVAPATGVPTIAAPATNQGFVAPPQIAANGAGGSAPAAPVQIAANASSSSPASPVQIVANGVGGSAPAAPPAPLE